MKKQLASLALYFCIPLLLLSLTPTFSLASSACADAAVSGIACERTTDPALVRSFASTHRHVGNPVDVLTGAKQQREIDYQAVGSPLHLSRYYHSGLTDTKLNLGQGWRHSYQVGLYAVDQQRLRIQQGDGRWIDFSRIENELGFSVYKAQLASDGYVVVDTTSVWYLPDGRAMHFHGSLLTHIEHSNGISLKLFYRQQQLQSVIDHKGRELRFEYVESTQALPNYHDSRSGVFAGHITQVVLPSGRRIAYEYDNRKNLEAVVYSDTESKHYRYQNSDYPHHLTSIVDPDKDSLPVRSWTYDANGRVIRFDASANESLAIRYTNTASSSQLSETVVDYDSGRQERYRWVLPMTNEPATLTEYSARDCSDCEEIRFAINTYQSQTSQSVIDDVQIRTSASATNKHQQQQGVLDGRYPDFHQIESIADSLDQRAQISIDGVSHDFYIRVNRLGEVLDISVGNTSLSALKDKWAEGDIERCDDAPLLRRTGLSPPVEKGCLEDLIYLIELVRQIEQLDDNHGLRSAMPRSGTNSNSNGSAGCLRNPFQSCSELERDFELAQLSGCAYAVQLQHCGSQWEVVTPASIGLSDAQFNDGSFACTLFYNATDNEYVLSFRGTDNFGDWKDNLMQASGRSTEQYELAVALAKELERVLPNADLSFTGHSLGGGLATAAALSIDSEAAVFNAAALHPDTAQKLGLNYADTQRLVTVTTVDGDLLTEFQEPDSGKIQLIKRHRAPGVHTQISAPDAQWIKEQQENASFLSGSEGVILHSITAVLESEERLLKEICNITPERA